MVDTTINVLMGCIDSPLPENFNLRTARRSQPVHPCEQIAFLSDFDIIIGATKRLYWTG
jgi:hypothetical protein